MSVADPSATTTSVAPRLREQSKAFTARLNVSPRVRRKNAMGFGWRWSLTSANIATYVRGVTPGCATFNVNVEN